MAKFQPGQKKPPNSGRKAGTTNKSITRAREAFALAFDAIGGIDGLARWARRNKGEFYRLYARMIPMEVTGTVGLRSSFVQAVQEAARSTAVPEVTTQPTELRH